MTTLIALCAYSASSHTWADRLAVCKVADPELQGEYVGQCNGWGNAEGYASVQGRASYVGEFKDGKKHGFGVKTWPSGEQYIGQFSDDAKNGYGIYKWPLKGSARDIYVGQFLNDQRLYFIVLTLKMQLALVYPVGKAVVTLTFQVVEVLRDQVAFWIPRPVR